MGSPSEPSLPQRTRNPRATRRLTRRIFLVGVGLPALAAAVTLALPGLPKSLFHWIVMRSRGLLPWSEHRAQLRSYLRLLDQEVEAWISAESLVVSARSLEPTGPGSVAAAVQRAICGLCGTDSAAAAFLTFVEPGATVAIRCGGEVHRGIVEAVVEGLGAAGIQPEAITLVFSGRGEGLPDWVAELGVQGERGVYADEQHAVGEIPLRLARALERCDHIINLASLNTHVFCQFSGALKNHFGSVDEPWRMHGSFEHSTVLLNHLDPIRSKQVLCLVDALEPALAGHPDFADPRFRWPLHTVLASRDPVAIDAMGIELLERGFRERSVPGDLGIARRQLTLAEALGLGVASAAAIRHRVIEPG
jgi:hypothetical protein